MCLTCGCGEPDADHRDSRHITLEDLKKAAEAAGVSVTRRFRNFNATVKQSK